MSDTQPFPKGFKHHGVWCCERKSQCRWQCFALHQGLAWGEIPAKLKHHDTDWRSWHDKECGGKLIQLIDPMP